jgi:hypothetical protein
LVGIKSLWPSSCEGPSAARGAAGGGCLPRSADDDHGRENPENGTCVASLLPATTGRNVVRLVRLLATTLKIMRSCEEPSAARGAAGGGQRA